MRYAGAWLFCGDGCLSVQTSPALRQVRLLLPLPPRFVTASDSQPWIIFMNIPLSLVLPSRWCVYTLCGWTNCPSYSPGHETCDRACHDWWRVDVSHDAGSGRETVARLSLQREMTEQQIQQTGSEFSHRMIFVAVLSASVAFDWDDIWGQTAGMEFLSLPFLSAASGIK